MKENEDTVKILTLEREHETALPLIRKAFQDANIAMQVVKARTHQSCTCQHQRQYQQ